MDGGGRQRGARLDGAGWGSFRRAATMTIVMITHLHNVVFLGKSLNAKG